MQDAAALRPVARQTQERAGWGTIGLVAAGSMLEFYEFQTFAIFIVPISDAFFSPLQPAWVRELQAFALLSIGFLFRPIAGAVVGQIGDRVGRRASFLITILMMALPTLGIGLLPGYARIGLAAPLFLLVLRVLQGMASAGELSGAAVFITESAPPQRVGAASGALYGAIHLGYLLAALVALGLNAAMPANAAHAYAWRAAFIVGGVLGLLALWARRRLHESPEFERMRAQRAYRQGTPFAAVLRGHWRQIVTVMLLAGYVGVSIAVVYAYAPAYLQTAYKVPAKQMSGIIAISFLTLSLSALVCGRLADRVGLRRVLSAGSGLVVLVSAVSCLLLGRGIHSPLLLLACYFCLSLAMGTVGCAFAVAASLFPTEIRLTGIGLSYNLGLALFLGTAPFIISALSARFGGLPIAAYLWAAAAMGMWAAWRARPLPARASPS